MTAAPCPLEACLLHLQVRNMRPNTISARRDHLRRLARFFELEPGEDLLLLTEGDLDVWQQSLLLHLAPRSRASAVAHVRQFFAFCNRQGYLEQDPSRVLVTPKIPERVPHPIPAQDLDTAIAFAPRRVRPMLTLAAYCGLRAGEIAQLTREQVRDQGEEPTLVVIGKGDKERVVPLPARVLADLHEFGLPATGPVFPRFDDPSRPSTAARISRLCGDFLHSLGIPESLHSLRHFYGTSMYAASRDLVLVQRTMGHSNPQTTSGYVAHDQHAAHAAAATVAQASAERQRGRLRIVAAPADRPIVQRTADGLGGPLGLGTLSERELQVVRLVAEGMTNRAAGAALGLSDVTVKSHLQSIGRKLGVRERAGIVAVALRTGLVAGCHAAPRPTVRGRAAGGSS